MKRILVLGTSTAAKYIAAYWKGRADVSTYGRRTTPSFDLLQPSTWPSYEQLAEFQEVHYTVHANVGVAQIMPMADLLRHLAQADIRLIVWTSLWGSITYTEDSLWAHLPYRLVKASMNMSCKVLAHQKETRARILLLHPGSYASKMNVNTAVDGEQVVHNALTNVEKWDETFMFMDGRTGSTAPF